MINNPDHINDSGSGALPKGKIKILAIDDNADNLVVMEALLSDNYPDAEYFTAESGKKGYELCQAERPDLVLLDLVMPDMGGLEVCEKIKANEKLRDIPVLIITANRKDKESRIAALEAGADGFLSKPVEESELIAHVQAMLRIKRRDDRKKKEKELLEDMVLERTENLEIELADRIRAENKLVLSLEKLKMNKQAVLNLLEDLKAEIRERIQTENTLKNERNLLRTLIDNIPFPIYVCDKECRKIIVNKADVSNICYDDESDVLGKTDLELLPGEPGVIGHENNLRVIQTGKPNIDIEECFHRKNGEEKWLLTSHFPLFSTEGDISGMVGIGYDITERRQADNKLKESEEKYRNLIENQGEGIGIVDLDEKFVFANPAAEEMFGTDPGGLMNCSLFNFLTEESKRIVISESNKRNGNEKSTYEIEIVRTDGARRILLITATPQVDGAGIMKGTFGVFRDITDRKLAEEKLKESHNFNTSLLQTIPFGMHIVDESGIILFENENFHKLFGDESIGKKCWEILRDDHKQDTDCPLKNGLHMGETGIFECSGLVGGKIFQVSHTGMMFNGKKAMLEIFQDITDRKMMENRIIESETYYRTLIETSPDGIIIVDLEGKVVYGSIKAYEVFGIPSGTRIDGTSVLNWVADVDEEKILKRFSDIMSGNVVPETREYLMMKNDRTVFWGELSSSQLLDPDGNPKALMIVCRDISARKDSEIQLLRSKEKAEESDRLKTAFLHNISHEIRTPMNAILGFTAMLDDTDLDNDTRRSYVEVINQSSFNLLKIVNDIIEISNIEAGLLKLNMGSINLNSILYEVFETYQPKTASKKIDFSIDRQLPEDKAVILADGSKLHQIISYLISNAVKFTSSGKISFGFSIMDDFIEFRVKDTGIGIPPEEHSRIFEHFYQIENTLARQYEGTGLGLPISRAYVELMGGKIWLLSKVGEGSEFYFTIPYNSSEIDHNN